MVEIYLIRHAESQANLHLEYIGGRMNETPLSEKGLLQAKLLGDRLKEQNICFDLVYASPAVRTLQTARISCQPIGYNLDQILIADDLQEMDMGQWVGNHRKDTYTPEIMAKIKADPWNFAAPGGESQRQVEERGLIWMANTIIPRSEEKLRIGVYTHAFFIKCLLRGIMNFDAKHTYAVEIDNTSITRLIYQNNHYRFGCINDAGHLLR